MKQNYNLLAFSLNPKTLLCDFCNEYKHKSMGVLLFLFTLLSLNDVFGQFPGNDNTPGVAKTFNVPAGVTSVTASAWGAGGGGGGSNLNGFGGNGGGGGGATTRVITVTGGATTFTYTVGTGGVAGSSAGGTGGNGTLSSITSGAPVTNMIANGGTGGRGNALLLNTPTNSGGGTASGGTTNANGNNGILGGGSGGTGGDSGFVAGIVGAGGNIGGMLMGFLFKSENITYLSPNLGSSAYATAGSATNIAATRNNYNFTNSLSFDRRFGANHHIAALAGYDVQKYENSSWGANQTNVSDVCHSEN